MKEYCDQVCQNSMAEVATRITLKASGVLTVDCTHGAHGLPQCSIKVNDCKHMILHSTQLLLIVEAKRNLKRM